MDRLNIFEQHKVLAVHKKFECFCCRAMCCPNNGNQDFIISSNKSAEGINDPLMIANEETGCRSRLCCTRIRPNTIKLHAGGFQLAQYDRPFRLFPSPCKVWPLLYQLFIFSLDSAWFHPKVLLLSRDEHDGNYSFTEKCPFQLSLPSNRSVWGYSCGQF